MSIAKMITIKTALFALAFLAEQIACNTCPPCYTHTVTARPEKICPGKNCGIVPLDIVCEDFPVKRPTITIPGPNPDCPVTKTLTAPGKCPTNPCSCEEFLANKNGPIYTTLPGQSCRSTGSPITKTLPPTVSVPTTTSCSKFKTVTDGLMCPMIACVRQTKACDVQPTLVPRPTKITLSHTRDCTVTHITGAPCPTCNRCRLDLPTETDYAIPWAA